MSEDLTKKEHVEKLLREAGENGCPAQELREKASLTQSALHSVVHGLRRKLIVKQRHSAYFFKGEKEGNQSVPAATPPASHPPISAQDMDMSKMLASRHFVKEVASLKESDRNDLYDYIQKSIFYRLGAEAVIKSHKVVEEFKKQLSMEEVHQQ